MNDRTAIFPCAVRTASGMVQIKWVMGSKEHQLIAVSEAGTPEAHPLVFQRNPIPIPELRQALREAIDAWLQKSPSLLPHFDPIPDLLIV